MFDKITRKERLMDIIITSLRGLENEVKDMYRYAYYDDRVPTYIMNHIESLEGRISGIKGSINEYNKII